MTTPLKPSDRRRSPRVEVRGRLKAPTDRPTEEVTLRDVSDGGFLVETSSPFAVDAVHAFRVQQPDGELVTMLVARCVHSRRRAESADAPLYLGGFAFVDPTGETARARILALIDHVTSVVPAD